SDSNACIGARRGYIRRASDPDCIYRGQARKNPRPTQDHQFGAWFSVVGCDHQFGAWLGVVNDAYQSGAWFSVVGDAYQSGAWFSVVIVNTVPETPPSLRMIESSANATTIRAFRRGRSAFRRVHRDYAGPPSAARSA